MRRVKKYLPYLLLFLLVFASRLPFLHAGYGVEEDSWGIALAAFHTATTGVYEPSRFPGHPVHEWIYSAYPLRSELFYNLFSAFFSAVAAVFFLLIMKHLNFRYSYLAALALAFTPVVYICSTYTIDFMWTLAFVLISFYLLLKEQFILCGIFLGLAIGCRVTMGAMLLPYLMIAWDKDVLKKMLRIMIPMGIVVLLAFMPLIDQFGWDFFMYYDQFPYPPITKVLYKMVIGVFGLLGTVVLMACGYFYFFRRDWRPGKLFSVPLRSRIITASFVVIVLFVISYFRLPQKSGYLITIIPFLILLAGYYLNGKWFVTLCLSLILSSFVFSINLTDKLRGSGYSRFAMTFIVSGQEIFFDPFTGPIFSDFSKRKQKMRYVSEVLEKAKAIDQPAVIIAGWWYNEIMVDLFPDERIGGVVFRSYIDRNELEEYAAMGCNLFYLPEQEIYNDQMFKMNATREFAAPF